MHFPLVQTMTLLVAVAAFHVSDAFCPSSQHQRLVFVSPRMRIKQKSPPVWTSLKQKLDNENIDELDNTQSSGFDGQGFAGYLAPYALALLGSVLVTAIVFKFFFLDY
mmetsp:Transcript_22877/g.33774  ORF Transcript_22877/g.33774 Transcript_22877/m.33774 type:complete len:108 (+) Transcript_22877:69-392(+)